MNSNNFPPSPGKPVTVRIRCDAGTVLVRAELLAKSGTVIVFPDGVKLDGATAVELNGQWHDVDAPRKNDASESYVFKVPRG
jgi:hypothetical protein